MDVYLKEDYLSLTNTLNVLCSHEIVYSSMLDQSSCTLPSPKICFLLESKIHFSLITGTVCKVYLRNKKS